MILSKKQAMIVKYRDKIYIIYNRTELQQKAQ